MTETPSDIVPEIAGYLEAATRHAARGWARDVRNPGRRVVVEALVDGRVLGQAVADLFRGDVAATGQGDGHCGFSIDLSAHAMDIAGANLLVCEAETGIALDGAPARVADPPSLARFLRRWEVLTPRLLSRLRRMMRHRAEGSLAVIPVRGVDLAALIGSLDRQLCDRWELILPHDVRAPPDRRIRRLAELPAADQEIDAALATANAPLALMVTRETRLEPDAVYHLLRTRSGTPADLIFWDAIQTYGDRPVVDALCRPAFSIDQYRGNPDLGGAFAVDTVAAREVGWGGGEVDFVLRLLERGGAVAHLPRVLHTTPAGARPAIATARQAVQNHLDRRARGARAALSDDARELRVGFPPAEGRTLVVIPTHNQADLLRECVGSLHRTCQGAPVDIVVIDHRSDDAEARHLLAQLARFVTVVRYDGPFNYARMNNLAVAAYGADAETLLFLNNDVEAIGEGWLERMASLAVRPDVGAVGALLLYGDRRVQHAGVVIGFDGSATHAHTLVAAYRADGSRNPGYGGQLTALREVSAVTGACMMLRREVFEQAGGFDETLPIGFNDTDLCLRLRARGLRILQDGQTVLYHHESRTRRLFGQILHPADTTLFQARYAQLIRAGDPFYSPHLRLEVQDHELRPDCAKAVAPRVVSPFGGQGHSMPGKWQATT